MGLALNSIVTNCVFKKIYSQEISQMFSIILALAEGR